MRFLALHPWKRSLAPTIVRAEEVRSLRHVKCNLQHSHGSHCQLVEREKASPIIGDA